MFFDTETVLSIFAAWKRIFRSKMRDEDWDITTAKIWVLALNQMGVTQNQFEQAKRKSVTLQWPPTAPADFVALASNEYTDCRQAYLEATNGKYVNAVTYETAKRVGFWDIKTKSESQTYPRWQQIYPKVCQEHAQGATFTLPKTHRLTDNSHKPIDWSSDGGKEIERRLQAFKRQTATQAPTKRATA